MPDHRDGPRMVNAMFPVFENLPASQQAVFAQLMGDSTFEASGIDAADLAEEVEEAKAHFRVKLSEMQ